MTKEQKQIATQELIMLDMSDVQEMTGWCENVVRNTFAYDENFPAIKKGKRYQVELGAFKEYLRKRRTNKHKNI